MLIVQYSFYNMRSQGPRINEVKTDIALLSVHYQVSTRTHVCI